MVCVSKVKALSMLMMLLMRMMIVSTCASVHRVAMCRRGCARVVTHAIVAHVLVGELAARSSPRRSVPTLALAIEVGFPVALAVGALVRILVLLGALVECSRPRVHTAALGLLLVEELVVDRVVGPADAPVVLRRLLGQAQA